MVAALWIMGSACSAEDLQFVDANGSTGYYVDVDSITYEGENIVNAGIAVKKAALNRMFLYTMQFDSAARTYQILSSQVVKYDTREVLERGAASETPHPYGILSPMSSIVDYIYSLKK